MLKKYCLKICLKSDICVATGYSYAGVIDSDTCYDKYGIPYIPSKRIKGCLRECATVIGEKNIAKIYGKPGQDTYTDSTALKISNAYLEQYSALEKDIKELMQSSKYSQIVSTQKILNEFTTIKAQTSIDEKKGCALENSLRYTRSVNHFEPGIQSKANEEKELTFCATVELDEQYQEEFTRAVKALRHMGMQRNRGLGNVRCTLSACDGDENKELNLCCRNQIDEEGLCALDFVIETQAPLIISQGNESVSETYIPGRNIMGYFASAYLKEGNSAESEEFENLFLKNNVKFGAFYPYKDGRTYYPAPAYISKLKKTKKYVNNTVNDSRDKKGDYDPKNGNQPKKLKGKYLAVVDETVDEMEIETEIIYHHRKKSADMEEQLYVLEAVQKGQVFRGKVEGKYKYMKKIIPLLQQNLYLGKSRNAQYGKCQVISTSVSMIKPSIYDYKKSNKIMVVLRSDAMFMDDKGYTVSTECVRKKIAEELAIPYKKQKDDYTEIEVKELDGYYSKWNLRRQSVPVVCAGSCFEYTLCDDYHTELTGNTVGIKSGEGFGNFTIENSTGANWKIPKMGQKERRSLPDEVQLRTELAKRLCRLLILKKIKEYLYAHCFEVKCQELTISPTSLGRVTLMLNESINRYPRDFQARFRDFMTRVSSIKDDVKREEIIQFLKEKMDSKIRPRSEKEDNDGMDVFSNQYVLCVETAKHFSEYEKTYDALCSEGERTLKDNLEDMWSEYLMLLLVQLKYEMKKKGEDSNEKNIL